MRSSSMCLPPRQTIQVTVVNWNEAAAISEAYQLRFGSFHGTPGHEAGAAHKETHLLREVLSRLPRPVASVSSTSLLPSISLQAAANPCSSIPARPYLSEMAALRPIRAPRAH